MESFFFDAVKQLRHFMFSAGALRGRPLHIYILQIFREALRGRPLHIYILQIFKARNFEWN